MSNKHMPPLSDPDLVDRIFEYLLAEFPHIAGPQFAKAKRAVREEFRGEEVYIAGRGADDRHDLVMSVLSLFNGRNASEVARRLGIGRTTVYRILKQAGGKDRPTFPGNGTGAALRSATSTAARRRQTSEPDPSWHSQPQTSQPSTPPSQAASSPSATTAEQSPTDP
jgi:transposase-like protein